MATTEPEIKVTPEAPVDDDGEYSSLEVDVAKLSKDYDPDNDPDVFTNEPYYDGALMSDADIDSYEARGGSEDTAVMCIFCKNCTMFTPDGITCKAWPEGVPEEILLGHDHRKALGDEKDNVLFEAKNQKAFDEWIDGINTLVGGSAPAPAEEEAPAEGEAAKPKEEAPAKKAVKARPKVKPAAAPATTEAPK